MAVPSWPHSRSAGACAGHWPGAAAQARATVTMLLDVVLAVDGEGAPGWGEGETLGTGLSWNPDEGWAWDVAVWGSRGRPEPEPESSCGEGAPLLGVDADAEQPAEARLAQLALGRAVAREHLHARAALLGHEQQLAAQRHAPRQHELPRRLAVPSDGEDEAAAVRELAHPVVARVGHVQVRRVEREARGAEQLALGAALAADAPPVAQPRRGLPHGDAPVAAVRDEERRAVQCEPLRARIRARG